MTTPEVRMKRAASELRNYLVQAPFPLNKHELKAYVCDQNAPIYIVELLDMIPNKQYENITDLQREINLKD